MTSRIFTISPTPKLFGCAVSSIHVALAFSHPHGGSHEYPTIAPLSSNAA